MLTRSVALVCLCIGVIPGALGSVKKAAQLAEREMLQWTVTSSKDLICQSVWQVHPDGSVDDTQQSGTVVGSDRNLCLHRDRAVFLERNRFNQINTMYQRIVIDLAGVKFQVNFERNLTEADLAAQVSDNAPTDICRTQRVERSYFRRFNSVHSYATGTKKKNDAVKEVFATIVDSVEKVSP